jgi:ATP-binding cassette subfamily C protein PrsD
MMIGASMISARALAPIDQVVAQWRPLLSARQAIGRLSEVLKGAEAKGKSPEVDLPLPTQSLTVSTLASGPSRQVGPLVRGVNFELTAGDGLGVLGLSGSGKTSLVRALLGIWPVLQGEVRLDGGAIWQYDSDRLGKTVGYLPQVVDLFSGTIAQNIARFRADADSEAIIRAAKSANVHDLILSFPAGYDTPVGELGSRLSAGQRQRIGLARALYGEPFLIILDEPNSNLDAVGDEALTASMHAARARGAIVVIVAHRPSAINSVNKLLYLQDGAQVKFGPKADVLREITAQPAPPPRQPEPRVVASV